MAKVCGKTKFIASWSVVRSNIGHNTFSLFSTSYCNIKNDIDKQNFLNKPKNMSNLK